MHVDFVGGKKPGGERGNKPESLPDLAGRLPEGGFSKEPSPGIKPGTGIHLQMIGVGFSRVMLIWVQRVLWIFFFLQERYTMRVQI